jgi:large subunit ribosomal protein L24
MQDTKRVKNPGKQRKRLFNAPAHIRHKLMSAPLSHELTASKGAKTLPVRKGDTILIKRGDNKGFEGKVSRVDLKAFRIYIEGLTREKVDGTNIFIPIHPSKVEIRNLNLDDKWRKKILERKKATAQPAKQKAKQTKKATAQPAKQKAKQTKKATAQPAKQKAKQTKKATAQPAKVEEVKEEKPVKVMSVKEKVAPEVAEKQAIDMATEEAPEPKKLAAKTTVKQKAAEKKAPVAKKTEVKEATAKPRAKSKSSEQTKGEQ